MNRPRGSRSDRQRGDGQAGRLARAAFARDRGFTLRLVLSTECGVLSTQYWPYWPLDDSSVPMFTDYRPNLHLRECAPAGEIRLRLLPGLEPGHDFAPLGEVDSTGVQVGIPRAFENHAMDACR